MYQKITYRFLAGILPLAIAFAAMSCGSEEKLPSDASVINVSASIKGQTGTRGYQEKGKILEGTFYLSYPISEEAYDIATVNFYDGTGFITVRSGGDLTWQKVGGVSNDVAFYLDNLSPDNGDLSAMIIDLSGDTRYSAGLFDYVDGRNDLLWGSASVARQSTNILSMQLIHCMAMVNVEITVDASDETSLGLDLSDATVEITNLIHDPQAYDRHSGRLSLAENPELSAYQPLTFVSNDHEQNGWKMIEEKIDGQEGKTKYTTRDYVLPPQDLLETVERPRLKIHVPTEDGGIRTFSGVIPRAMTVVMQDGTSIPMSLSFLRGHVLTLTVTMTPEKMELEFMPVTVVDWVYKGDYSLSGGEAGVFKSENFNRLLDAIAALKEAGVSGEDPRVATYLQEFAYKDRNGVWIFDIFANLTLEYDDIYGVFAGVPIDYRFEFNGKTIIVEKDGEPLELRDNTGAETFKAMLDGNYQQS